MGYGGSFSFLMTGLWQGGALYAVSRKRVVAKYRGAVGHHECGGDACLNVLPDPLFEISVQCFVATAEASPIVLRSERFDRKQTYRPAALAFS